MSECNIPKESRNHRLLSQWVTRPFGVCVQADTGGELPQFVSNYRHFPTTFCTLAFNRNLTQNATTIAACDAIKQQPMIA